MNNGIKCFLTFSAGVAIGVATSWRILKSKYEQLTREEIASYKEHKEALLALAKEEQACKEEQEKKAYESIADTYVKGGETVSDDKPYVITPEEFGDVDDYATETIYYYADGVLVDTDDNEIEDVDGLIGTDSLTHFGEYEDDSVFVRNDKLKCDYEILLDSRKYSDVLESLDSPDMEG